MQILNSQESAILRNRDLLTNRKHYDIYVGLSSGKGVGLFSSVSIPQQAVIAESVARRVQVCAKSLDPVVSQYLFVDPAQYCGSRPAHDSIIACSEITLLNHSETPNSRVIWEYVSTEILRAKLISIREIHPSEELTIFYTDADAYQGLRSLSKK